MNIIIAYANIQTIMDEKTHLEQNTIYCRVAYTLYATLPLPASTLQQLFLELTVNCAALLMNHLISSKRYFNTEKHSVRFKSKHFSSLIM